MRPPAFTLLAQATAPAAEAKQYWLGNAGRFTVPWIFRCAANDNGRAINRLGHRDCRWDRAPAIERRHIDPGTLTVLSLP